MADRYSFSLTTFSPSGKLVQIEYALNAVNQGVTSLGIKATNGIVLATEKKSSSPLIDSASSSKVSLITPNIGMVYSGMGPDYRVLVDKARKVSHTEYKRIYNEYPPTRILVQDVARVMQEATQSGGVRPYGVSLLIAGWDDGIEPEAEDKSEEQTSEEKKKVSGKTGGILKGGPSLYQVDPSGSYFPWKATAIGKSATSAKTFLEKRYTDGLELEDAIHIALLTLKETIEGEMNGDTVEIGIVGPPEERLLGVEGVEGARVWFLAPTVTLCEQQSKVFKHHLPSYNVLVLSGQDDIDHWTEQSVWDSVLFNVRIVLSTHQVLLDALFHAFVKMDELALLIFDEAHHCTLNHPANRIMSNFYIPRVRSGDKDLPSILGLSASPVMRAHATTESLRQIERNLNSTTKTPKRSRSELAQHVHQPELIRVDYSLGDQQADRSPLLAALSRSYREYDLMQDPYTRDLLRKQESGADVSRQLQTLFSSQKTYCIEQLKTLTWKTQDLTQELGLSAAEWYLHQCMQKFEDSILSAERLFDWSNDEKQHLLEVMRQLPFHAISPCPSLDTDGLSQKAETLIEILVSEAQDNSDFTGLIFVEQRIWVAVLAEIISMHPRTRDLFRVGTFLGSSSNKRKAMIATFAEPKNQQTTLEDFQVGRKNLILATSVLEEGIDVSSCHLVICFERPKNLKSFVQRRGRARMLRSKYFVFMPRRAGGHSPETWEILEQEMKKAYLDEQRQSQLAHEQEAEEEKGSPCTFEVDSTGARLTLENAVSHLNHFCSTLASGPYVDPRPQFKFMWSEVDHVVTAEVTLPICVDRAVRKAQSLNSWRTEKMATKDVAFEAYKALYLAGLVNDNLLPVRQEFQNLAAEFQVPDKRPSMVRASPTLDPWCTLIQHHQQRPRTWFRTLIQIQTVGEVPLYMYLLTLKPIPPTGRIDLFWSENKTYTATMSTTEEAMIGTAELNILRSVTRRILLSIYSPKMQEERNDFLWLIAPCNSGDESVDFMELTTWDKVVVGRQLALSLLAKGHHLPRWGLISHNGDHRKYLLQAILSQQQAASHTQTSGLYLQATRVPKRRDFLHRVIKTGNANDAYTRREDLKASECVVDNLPASYSVAALLLPSIMHKIEVSMIADTVRTTLLAPVDIQAEDLPLVVRALTASSTHDENNYQRLEFLGDCILKFISSLHVMAKHPQWPESYLTGEKGKIVSNSFLARATLAIGLDKFIITKHFTGAKWSPRYLGDLVNAHVSSERPERSSKLLADVVESLIGTCYMIAGFPKAFACVQTLLPLVEWMPISEANGLLYQMAPTELSITTFDVLESLIGYVFRKKMLLLEALTHASYTGPNDHCSYERLEYLGDAVLDYIVSKRLYMRDPPLSHQTMHAMRTAMANAAFLAFRMLETTIAEQTSNKVTLQTEIHQRALWQYLRTGSIQLTTSREVALQQHAMVREQLNHALEYDDEFPWHLLALTNAPKFLSDIVESVIGAVYVDSEGDFSACEVFVRRLGILTCLDRLLHDDVDCLHPKERLGHLAVERSVQYASIRNDAAGTADPPAGVSHAWKCQVKVGGEDVGGVVEGLTRLNAETIAAWRANEILRGKGLATVDSSGEQDIFFDAEELGGIALGDC
ncbi:proteasome A-type and B-type [Stagonosporopsis vannaccii]|nr:proteasome A-type and B-type [Stagonosporopsis vannaccii]